jgi:hypothetical protein
MFSFVLGLLCKDKLIRESNTGKVDFFNGAASLRRLGKFGQKKTPLGGALS